jgi:ligand-binding SRPBCC domain-containing protein
MAHIQISELIPAPRQAVFEYLTDPKNLVDLLEPIVQVEVLNDVALKRGNEFHFNMTRFGLTQSVRLRIEDVLLGSRMTYRQSEGLFVSWVHSMKFDDHDDRSTLVTDLVDYQVPFGILGYLTDDLLLKNDMRHLLAHRLRKAKEHFEAGV